MGDLLLPPGFEKEKIDSLLKNTMRKAANKRVVMICSVHGPLDERDELHVGIATAGGTLPPVYICQICKNKHDVISQLYPVFVAKDYFACVVCGERTPMIGRFHLSPESEAAGGFHGNLCCHVCARMGYLICDKCGFLVASDVAIKKEGATRPIFFCPDHAPILDSVPLIRR